MTVLDIITREQLIALREAGFVVIHRESTNSMVKAAIARKWPEDRTITEAFRRMVAESIRLQNIEIKKKGSSCAPIVQPDSWG